jgi:hypothetical protein
MSGRQDDRSDRIADYLRGVLDEEATRQLELDMLEDPELFEQIQSQDLLRQGLAGAEAEPASGKKTFRPARAGWLWGGYVLAGGLAAVVIGLGVRLHDLDRQLESFAEPSVGIQVITLQTQRALVAPDGPRLPDEVSGKGVLIEIDVSAGGDGEFTLVVETERGAHEWAGMRVDARGYLTVFVPAGERPTGLVVRDKAGRVVAEFP